jgi:hypothetical protein
MGCVGPVLRLRDVAARYGACFSVAEHRAREVLPPAQWVHHKRWAMTLVSTHVLATKTDKVFLASRELQHTFLWPKKQFMPAFLHQRFGL